MRICPTFVLASFVSCILVSFAYAPTLVSGDDAAEEPTEPMPAVKKERPSRPDEDHGFVYIYREDKSIQKFLTSTPCVSGVWWRYRTEDDKHWIGELHYPTENTGSYDDPKKASPQYYMVFDIAIKKEADLPIDPKTYRGALVLRDPKPDTPLSTKGDGTPYELVAYENADAKNNNVGFLFSRNKDLKYQPPKE